MSASAPACNRIKKWQIGDLLYKSFFSPLHNVGRGMDPLLLKQGQGHSAQKPFWFASVVDVHAFEILPCCGDSLDNQRPLFLLASQKSYCLCSLLSWLGHPKLGGVKSFEGVIVFMET